MMNELAKLLGITQVSLDECEVGMRHQVGQVPLLVNQRVIIVEIIQSDDGVAAIENAWLNLLPTNPAAPVTKTFIASLPELSRITARRGIVTDARDLDDEVMKASPEARDKSSLAPARSPTAAP